jgi:hypothetical protein
LWAFRIVVVTHLLGIGHGHVCHVAVLCFPVRLGIDPRPRFSGFRVGLVWLVIHFCKRGERGAILVGILYLSVVYWKIRGIFLPSCCFLLLLLLFF